MKSERGELTHTATAAGPASAMSPEPSLTNTGGLAVGAAHAGVAHTSERATRVSLTVRQRSQHGPGRTTDEEDMLDGREERPAC